MRSYLGSCSSGNDELAQPSQAADEEERSEHARRCYRRTRNYTLDERGQQGVGCSCVVAIDVLGHLSMAMRQARLVGSRGMVVWPVPGRLGCMLPALVLWGVSWLA